MPHIVSWDDPAVDWHSFELSILRSCWDYHLRYDEFLEWLGRLEAGEASVMNPIQLVRWNSDKKYLLELNSNGIPTIPTHYLPQHSSEALEEVLITCNWNDVIVKPSISASAYRTHRVKRDSIASFENEFGEMVSKSGILIQPFLREIQSDGELSLIYFGREFSHAVRKKPKHGDYRSQEIHGGDTFPEKITERHLSAANRVMDYIKGDFLYARVDLIETDGSLLLSELELIEPSLYFTFDENASVKFVAQIVSRL